MIVCCQCKVVMRCDKNSVGAQFGAAHVYPGDRFVCPKCGSKILKTNESPIHDPLLATQDEYLKMEEIEHAVT